MNENETIAELTYVLTLITSFDFVIKSRKSPIMTTQPASANNDETDTQLEDADIITREPEAVNNDVAVAKQLATSSLTQPVRAVTNDMSAVSVSRLSGNETIFADSATLETLPSTLPPTEVTSEMLAGARSPDLSRATVSSMWSGLEWVNAISPDGEPLPRTLDGFEAEYMRWHVLMKEKQSLSNKSLSSVDGDGTSLLEELETEEMVVEQLLKEISEGPPARPCNVRLYLQPSQHALRVEWDGPIWSIHVPVEAYSVEVLKDNNQHWQYLDTVRTAEEHVCHYQADDLESGTYVFRVIPFNHVGSGPPAISCAAKVD